jgi:thiol-disulfide isomerase/thioredoxin
MPALRPAVALLSMFLAASIASAQSGAPAKPADPKAPSTDEKPKDKKPEDKAEDNKSAATDGYPDKPAKELYAKLDLRGKPAPDFYVEKWLSTEPSRKGKTVLIDFWATWCPPCRELVPELSQWQKTYKDDLVVIGVSDEEPATLEAFIKAKNVDYAIATDTKQKMNKFLGISGIPHVLLISSDGIVRWQGFPLAKTDPLTEDKLKQVIDTDKAARAKLEASKKAKPTKPDAAKPDAKEQRSTDQTSPTKK